jgi:outer membrane scaffolding protein for murein synthesis (MipA/OmpV family)
MLTRSFIGISLVATLALPLVAAAQDFTPISDRILSDPTYLPLKGQFYGESSYDYSDNQSQNFRATGENLSSASRTLNTIAQTFAYGVTDRLSINVSEAYGFSGTTKVTNASGVASNGQSGWFDPTIGLTYRLADQKEQPFILDLFGHYSPDAFDSRNASNGQVASDGRGGPAVDFGLALARETKMFTIRGSVTATYYGESTDETNSLERGNLVTGSYWAPTLGVQTQTRLTDRLSANVNADYTFNGSPMVRNNLSDLDHVEDIGNTADVGVSLNYHLIPNKLVGSINYVHTFNDHTNLSYLNDATLDTYHWGTTNDVGFSLKYVFQ